MDGVARLSPEDRAALFNETAARRGLASGIIEKDFWVCWTLKRLFALGDDAGLAPVFKGGTSLSKVYGVIRRFSEDIDLSFDRRSLGYIGVRDPEGAPSTKQANRLIENLVADVRRHIAETLLPRLAAAIATELGTPGTWDLALDPRDAQTVIFRYPPSLAAHDYASLSYIRPVVQLELGARGDTWPAERRVITPYAAEEFPDFFKAASSCDVTVLAVERTFWEKATILHAEFHRPSDKPGVERISRHYYDLALLSESEHGASALRQLDLLESVARHKARFFPAAWARYNLAKPGSLRLVPPPERLPALVADYGKMAPMIFDTPPPPFSYLMERLTGLEARVNAMAGAQTSETLTPRQCR